MSSSKAKLQKCFTFGSKEGIALGWIAVCSAIEWNRHNTLHTIDSLFKKVPQYVESLKSAVTWNSEHASFDQRVSTYAQLEQLTFLNRSYEQVQSHSVCTFFLTNNQIGELKKFCTCPVGPILHYVREEFTSFRMIVSSSSLHVYLSLTVDRRAQSQPLVQQSNDLRQGADLLLAVKIASPTGSNGSSNKTTTSSSNSNVQLLINNNQLKEEYEKNKMAFDSPLVKPIDAPPVPPAHSVVPAVPSAVIANVPIAPVASSAVVPKVSTVPAVIPSASIVTAASSTVSKVSTVPAAPSAVIPSAPIVVSKVSTVPAAAHSIVPAPSTVTVVTKVPTAPVVSNLPIAPVARVVLPVASPIGPKVVVPVVNNEHKDGPKVVVPVAPVVNNEQKDQDNKDDGQHVGPVCLFPSNDQVEQKVNQKVDLPKLHDLVDLLFVGYEEQNKLQFKSSAFPELSKLFSEVSKLENAAAARPLVASYKLLFNEIVSRQSTNRIIKEVKLMEKEVKLKKVTHTFQLVFTYVLACLFDYVNRWDEFPKEQQVLFGLCSLIFKIVRMYYQDQCHDLDQLARIPIFTRWWSWDTVWLPLLHANQSDLLFQAVKKFQSSLQVNNMVQAQLNQVKEVKEVIVLSDDNEEGEYKESKQAINQPVKEIKDTQLITEVQEPIGTNEEDIKNIIEQISTNDVYAKSVCDAIWSAIQYASKDDNKEKQKVSTDHQTALKEPIVQTKQAINNDDSMDMSDDDAHSVGEIAEVDMMIVEPNSNTSVEQELKNEPKEKVNNTTTSVLPDSNVNKIVQPVDQSDTQPFVLLYHTLFQVLQAHRDEWLDPKDWHHLAATQYAGDYHSLCFSSPIQVRLFRNWIEGIDTSYCLMHRTNSTTHLNVFSLRLHKDAQQEEEKKEQEKKKMQVNQQIEQPKKPDNQQINREQKRKALEQLQMEIKVLQFKEQQRKKSEQENNQVKESKEHENNNNKQQEPVKKERSDGTIGHFTLSNLKDKDSYTVIEGVLGYDDNKQSDTINAVFLTRELVNQYRSSDDDLTKMFQVLSKQQGCRYRLIPSQLACIRMAVKCLGIKIDDLYLPYVYEKSALFKYLDTLKQQDEQIANKSNNNQNKHSRDNLMHIAATPPPQKKLKQDNNHHHSSNLFSQDMNRMIHEFEQTKMYQQLNNSYGTNRQQMLSAFNSFVQTHSSSSC